MKLDVLRERVRALEGRVLENRKARVLPFGDPSIDNALPYGGLELDAVHEIFSCGLEADLGASQASFAATIASRMINRTGKPILWAAQRTDCYGPALWRYGLDPFFVVWVECVRNDDVLNVMEEALHSGALSAVIGEAGVLSVKAGRRLSAAARLSATPALLIRRHFSSSRSFETLPSGAAATRWQVRSTASFSHSSGLGPPRLMLDLEYCRNGKSASFVVEIGNSGTNGEILEGDVRVVTEFCNDARPFKTPRARKTG